MNHYLKILDETERLAEEEPPIGIILCAEKDNIDVEFALRDISRPVGVAEYHLTKNLPKQLIGQLPSVEELKSKIEEELDQGQ